MTKIEKKNMETAKHLSSSRTSFIISPCVLDFKGTRKNMRMLWWRCGKVTRERIIYKMIVYKKIFINVSQLRKNERKSVKIVWTITKKATENNSG